MEDVGLKLENLFVKAGHSHCYQYVITILFALEYCCTHLLNYFIPYFERVPEVRLNGSKETQEFNFEFCDNLDNYTIIHNKNIQTSIVNEFGILCNKKKIYFLGLCYYVGKFFGSCASYLLIDRVGRKIPLIIFIPISIALLVCFKFMKASNSYDWIYGIYVDLFLSGISNYIIIIDILIYISEIIQQTKIPYFIMFVATGVSISGLLSAIVFYVDKTLDWRDILLIFAGIHFVVYILILFIQINSPMFALNMERFEDFITYISKIASRNGVELTQHDFSFLDPYIKNEKRQKTMLTGQQQNLNDNLSAASLNITEKLGDNQSVNISDNKAILDQETIEMKALKSINKEGNKDGTYTDGLNKFYSEGGIIYSNNNFQRNDSMFIKNTQMKDVYLLSLGEDVDVPVKSLFGESKMKDFTPLDLLKFNSQIKNFTYMCIIWIITDIIRTGIDFRKKYMYDYIGKIQFPVIDFCLEILQPFILLMIYHKYPYSLQRILVMANIVQFVMFVFVGFFIQKAHSQTQVVFLMLGKVCCHAVYLVMYVITLAIYPIMIRTKGVGFNIGFSAIGTIITIFLVENLKFDTLLLYFLLFNFFSMVICYGLPMKIGTFLLDNPKLIKDQEDEDDIKLGDICIENNIMVKPTKEIETKKKEEKKEEEKPNK